MMEKNVHSKDLSFVVIDMQKKFAITHENKERSYDAKVRNINIIADKFRKAGKPVIFVKYIGGDEEHHNYKGADGDDLFDDIEFKEGDLVVEKGHMNSFTDTLLEKTVKDAGSNAILFAGTVTQYCVMSTYFASFDHDLTPYLAHDACVSTRDSANDAAEEVCKTLEMDVIDGYLAGDESVVGDNGTHVH